MFHTLDVPKSCLALWKTCQTLIPELLKDIQPLSPDRVIRSDERIDPNDKSVYLLKSGTVSEVYDNKLLLNYEEGDLFAVDGLLNPKQTRYDHEFAITVDEYDGETFLNSVLADKDKFFAWYRYTACLSQSFQLILCHFSPQDVSFRPEYRMYNAGDVIIEENTEGDEVFTLLAGSAQVIVDNTTVGEINNDEIFGAIAALTNTKRTASIVATDDCETIVVKSDSFRSLLTARPDTVTKLVNDMARTIVSCNEKIMELSHTERANTEHTKKEE